MSANEPTASDAPEAIERLDSAQTDDDVEGHNFLIHPTVAGQIADARSREIERQVRDSQRARESRAKETPSR